MHRKIKRFSLIAILGLVLIACGREASLSVDELEEINLQVRTNNEQIDSWREEIELAVEELQALYETIQGLHEEGQNILDRNQLLFEELDDTEPLQEFRSILQNNMIYLLRDLNGLPIRSDN